MRLCPAEFVGDEEVSVADFDNFKSCGNDVASISSILCA